MKEAQLDFLTDDVMEHMPGPSLSGHAEFEQVMRVRETAKMQASVADWRAPEPPCLDGMDEVFLDLETTGLRWWAGDLPIGAGIWTPDGQKRYLPWGHRGGQNLDEATVKRWAERELRGKRIVNIRTKFDLHMFRAWGVDLEAQGCTFGDVAHYAALLDDHRKMFNQADLAREMLEGKLIPPGAGKVTTSHGYELDPRHFADYPAGLVAPRAESDVEIVHLLQKVMWPQMTEQGLHKVRAIEDAVIPVVVEMEHNGAPIDVETLDRWCKETEQVVDNAMWEIRQSTGCDLASPNKREDVRRLFQVLGLEPPLDPETSEFSIADELLARYQHPQIQKLRLATQVLSLRSKFLLKYQRSVIRDGILRYELHQLPYQKEQGEDGGGGGGAVSGRFSSAAPSKDEGANIQQVFGVKKQQGDKDKATGEYLGFTRHWPIKNLFLPDRRTHKNAVWLKADASQFQFRLFAHYANSASIIAAYQRDIDWREIDARAEAKLAAGLPLTKDDKLTDYHEVVQELVSTVKELGRTHTKNVNFAQVFGAGPRKMAAQLGVPADQIPGRNEPLDSGGPLFLEVLAISETYHAMFPEVKPLLALTGHLAMPEHKTGDHGCGRACRAFHRQGYTHRGWVRTFLGRRARFGPHDRHYSALNRVIQGTEGDINKRVLIEVHNLRHELGLTPRFTVHDELDADLHDPKNTKRVKEVLNTQYYDFRVPILWELGIGPSWGEAK